MIVQMVRICVIIIARVCRTVTESNSYIYTQNDVTDFINNVFESQKPIANVQCSD